MQQNRRPASTGNNVFLIAALFIAGVAILATAGTYAYDRFLKHELESRAAELAEAQRSVNQDQVEDFVRLRDRLSYGMNLLNSHVALSQAFDMLESETLTNVKFKTLKIGVANDRTARLEIDGTARNFNALAAQSNAFAADKRIKSAIFSGITVNKDTTVNFALTADLDTKLIVSQNTTAPALAPQANPAPVSLPAASTTAPVATTTGSTATTTTP